MSTLSQFFLHYHHSTIQDEIIQNMTDNHTQIWIAQDKDANTTKLMFKKFTGKVLAMRNVGNYTASYISLHK